MLGEAQNGVHPGRHTAGNLFTLRALADQAPHNQKGNTLFLAFIEFEKAYDRVNTTALF